MNAIAPAERRIYDLGIETRGVETVNGHQFLHGRAVPYNTPADIGWFMEEHAPGSLAASIKEAQAGRGLPLLMFHNADTFPIGVSDSWDDNREALDGVWKLDDSEEAQRAAKLATPDENGHAILGYMSIRFAPEKSEWTYVDDFNPDLGPDHKDRVVRVKSRLVETSLVSTPAFKEATVEFVRTAERSIRREDVGAANLAAWRAELEQLKAGPRGV